MYDPNDIKRSVIFDERKAIMEYLRQCPRGATADQIANYTLIQRDTVEGLLRTLNVGGHVQAIGRYWLIS